LRLTLLEVAGIEEVEVLRERGMVRVAYNPAQVQPGMLPTLLVQCPQRYSVQVVLTSRPVSVAEQAAAGARGRQAQAGGAPGVARWTAQDAARHARIRRSILARIERKYH
jgi:hypothetical protein